MAEVTFSAVMSPGRFIQMVTQGTMSGRGCQRGSTLLKALCIRGSAAVSTQTALLAAWVTQDLPTCLNMLWQAHLLSSLDTIPAGHGGAHCLFSCSSEGFL